MSRRLAVEPLEDRCTPATGFDPTAFLVAAADAGAPPEVRVLDPTGNRVIGQFLAFDGSFIGGVRAAVGDINGDGVPDIVAGAGPGGGPHVRAWDGRDGSLLRDFFAYESAFKGGVYVAVGDVNGDGAGDIVTGAGAGGGAQVAVFDGRGGNEIGRFFAYEPGFRGGVRVAAGDVNGDGRAEIITGAGASGGPHVQVFDFDAATRGGRSIGSFFAYDPSFANGVFVAAGDVGGDGVADIVTGTSFGGGSHVRVFTTPQGDELAGPLGSFFAYEPAFTGGVRVAAADLDGDGAAEIVTSPGAGGGPLLKVFGGGQADAQASLFAFPTEFRVGTQVAAGAGAAAFPSTPDAEIAQAYADLEAAILRARQRLRPKPPPPKTVVVPVPVGVPVFTSPFFFGAAPVFLDPFLFDPFFFDAPSFFFGIDTFFAPGFFPDPGFFADPFAFDAGFFADPLFFGDPSLVDPFFLPPEVFFPPDLIAPPVDPFFSDPFFFDPGVLAPPPQFFLDPFATDPFFFGDPFFSDPFFSDPFFSDPFFSDPFFSDPFFSDPFFSGPGFMDPFFFDPGFSDPFFFDPGFSDPFFGGIFF